MIQINLFIKHKQTHKLENKLSKGERELGRDKLGVWDQQKQTTMYKIDKQQRPTVQHKGLYSITCNKPFRKEYEKEYTHTYINFLNLNFFRIKIQPFRIHL